MDNQTKLDGAIRSRELHVAGKPTKHVMLNRVSVAEYSNISVYNQKKKQSLGTFPQGVKIGNQRFVPIEEIWEWQLEQIDTYIANLKVKIAAELEAA